MNQENVYFAIVVCTGISGGWTAKELCEPILIYIAFTVRALNGAYDACPVGRLPRMPVRPHSGRNGHRGIKPLEILGAGTI